MRVSDHFLFLSPFMRTFSRWPPSSHHSIHPFRLPTRRHSERLPTFTCSLSSLFNSTKILHPFPSFFFSTDITLVQTDIHGCDFLLTRGNVFNLAPQKADRFFSWIALGLTIVLPLMQELTFNHFNWSLSSLSGRHFVAIFPWLILINGNNLLRKLMFGLGVDLYRWCLIKNS